MRTIQCGQCGADNSPGSESCAQCLSPLSKPPVAAVDRADDSVFDPAKAKAFLASELGHPPRRVPMVLVLAAFRPFGVLLSIPILLVAHAMYTLFYGSQGGATDIVWIIVPATLWLWLGLRRTWLLKRGVAARAEKLEARPSKSYESSNFRRRYSGWYGQRVNYSGPVYTNLLRLWRPDGKSYTFKLRGLEYEGGIFLFLPKKPRCRALAGSYGVPIRPGEDGQWRVWPEAKKTLLRSILIGIGLNMVAYLFYTLFFK